ncbi:MAG: 30S ribosomal protein S12 methylthiotransferase RimO [Clostridiaceae bacterium]|nr:30S ribosomal protein S12 methylthiotransferase RimO [Clostridiaceae bacterium]MDO4494499.1 30S ribosomal protein S12 methylthiotransferase RimO [Clostridiaceae bacterium]
MYKIGMISLGCPKNQVDAERMLAQLDKNEFEITDCYEGADAVIVNTCGFIDAAKQEAIENILDMAQLKADGTVGKIIVTGCLAQRYKKEIFDEMPEVDAVVGIGANANIADIVKRVINGEKLFEMPGSDQLPLTGERLLTTPEYWSYLKIADGCSNRCTYCAIPSIRGDYRSVEFETVIDEAKQLAAAGTKELILIAQDTTNYGSDLYGKLRLPELLDALCEIDGIEWIRMLYCYPDKITDELLETIARRPKVLPYIDLPLQHADDGILKAMNRRGDSAFLREVIAKIRSALPDAVIRTTFIVGFPGEGEKEFENLAEFVNEIEFDRLGCFAFSPQEGTPAFNMENTVDEDVKLRRGEIIMQDQLEIVTLKNRDRIGKTYRVLVEDYDGYTDSYSGRTYMDAPEIDGTVSFTTNKNYEPGDFADVVIIGVNDYDLIGKDLNG